MGRKVARGLRGKSGVSRGGKAVALRQGATPTPTPPHKGEGFRRANPLMPGLRIREDGWTVARTRTFLAALSQTGCVTDAARVAGISRKSVNQARARFDEFDRACSTALARAGRGLKAIAYERAVVGREMVIIRDGKEVERRIMPSDSMLGLLLKRGDLGDGEGGGGGAVRPLHKHYDGDAVISAEEHMEGWRFDGAGIKYFHPGSAIDKLLTKLTAMRASVAAEEAESGACSRCGQPAADEAVRERLASCRAAADSL